MKKQITWKKVLLAILIICIAWITSIVSIGFIRYRTLISEQPLADKITAIQKKKTYVGISEISPVFLDAIIAIEDPPFYSHHGVLLSNILEAGITNLKEKKLAMGGSTITQQLAKNIYLDQDKHFTRKTAELFFVHDLEGTLTKKQILELYLNVIYFGDGYYGIKEAAQGYFHKSPGELNAAEASLLAGLPQAPAVYQLSSGYQEARIRQKEVLKAMVENQMIDEKQSKKIYQQNLKQEYS